MKQTTGSAVSDMVVAELPIAGFWRRLAALAIDFFAWGLVDFGVRLAELQPIPHVSALSSILDMLFWMTAFVAYLVIGQSIWGRTFGKWLVRLRVVGPDAQPPGWTRARTRNLVLSLPWLVLMAVVIVATGMFFTNRLVARSVNAAFTLLGLALVLQIAFTAARGRPSLYGRLAGTRVILLPRPGQLHDAIPAVFT